MVGTYGGWAVNSLRFYAELAKLKEQTMEQKYKQGEVVKIEGNMGPCTILKFVEDPTYVGNTKYHYAEWDKGRQAFNSGACAEIKIVGPWPEPLTASFECEWNYDLAGNTFYIRAEHAYRKQIRASDIHGKRFKTTIEEIV